MKVMFILDDHEAKVTPMKVADALIEKSCLSNRDLEEIVAYLSFYTKYHKEEK